MKKVLSFTLLAAMFFTLTTVPDTVFATTEVTVTDLSDFQSDHPYENNEDTTWVYTHPEDCEILEITFSLKTDTEQDFDFIYIMDENDNNIEGSPFHGNQLSGATKSVNGRTVKIRLTSDESFNEYGFEVTSILIVSSTGPITNLRVTRITRSSVTFSFPSPENATNIELQVSQDGGAIWESAETTELLNSSSTTATVDGLEFETEYKFRLVVTGGEREGISNVVEVKTLGEISPESDFDFDPAAQMIMEYLGSDAEVTIPKTIEGVTVTAIANDAFYNCDTLFTVNIPDSITYIGDWAFEDCNNLTAVTIPNSVTETGEGVFYNCTSLNSITIPDSISTISDLMFYNCAGLTSVSIPDSVTYIGEEAFYGCSSLNSIIIPNSVIEIDYLAFYGCNSLTSVTIPESVTDIGDEAFSYCTSLTAINVDSNNPEYSSDDGVLFDKPKEVLITYPAGKSGAYIIPDSVTDIAEEAFFSCDSLTSITIPNGITAINNWMFSYCISLTAINVVSDNPEYSSQDGILFNKSGEMLLIFPTGKSGAYTIPDSVTDIGEGAFYNCTKLISVTIPDSITSISEYAFEGCRSLTSLTIPDSITEICEGAFVNCYGLTSVTIPDSVTYIGEAAFYNCCKLNSVTIPTSITFFDDYVFAECDSMTTITIPNTVTYIGFYAFGSCDGLTSVTIPKSVSYIDDYAFEYCSSLTSVTILSNITDIGYDVFNKCPDDLIIYGYAGSDAEAYAYDFDILFIAISDAYDFLIDISSAVYNADTQSIDLSVIINNINSKPANAYLSVAVHDSKNKLLKVKSRNIEIQDTQSPTFTDSIALSAVPEDGYIIKVFLWDGMDNITPIAAVDSLNINNN
ncbi:MAG: Fibronectin type III domain protein [Firmicutes bacterium ADurb.Bin193]|nr:MAG: Fibronectin type III domain protein [Firmicutes bacterium ADurb.Bin193]